MRRYALAVLLPLALLTMAVPTPTARADQDIGRCSSSASDIDHGDFQILTDGGFAGNVCSTTVALTDGGTHPARRPCVSCSAATFNGLRASCVAAFRAANCP